MHISAILRICHWFFMEVRRDLLSLNEWIIWLQENVKKYFFPKKIQFWQNFTFSHIWIFAPKFKILIFFSESSIMVTVVFHAVPQPKVDFWPPIITLIMQDHHQWPDPVARPLWPRRPLQRDLRRWLPLLPVLVPASGLKLPDQRPKLLMLLCQYGRYKKNSKEGKWFR